MADVELRPARDAEEVVRFAEGHEPAGTRMIAELLRWGLGRTNRAFVVERGSDIVGALTVTRRCLDRWHATIVIDDIDAAPLLADAVDHSKTWSVTGSAAHVAPVLPHLRRTPLAVGTVPFHGSDKPTEDLAELDPRVRMATPSDLDALVQLYARFEQQDVPTRPRLRRFLADALGATPIVVAEVDGRIVGAMRLDWPSRAYAFWWALTVLPEYRGLGLGNGLMINAMSYSGRRGLRMCGLISDSNPMRVMEGRMWEPFKDYDRHHLEVEWMTARLGPPRRSLLHRVARRGLETIEGRTGPR